MAIMISFWLALIIYISLVLLLYSTYKLLFNKDLAEEELNRIYNTQKSVILRNASPKETMIHTKILLEKTDKDVNIISGSFNEILYSKSKIRDLITEVLEKGLKIKMYVGPRYNQDQMVFFRKLKKKYENLKIFVVNDYPPRHIIVAGNYFRIEDKHEENAKEFKALVGRDEKISRAVRSLFNEFKIITKDNLIAEV